MATGEPNYKKARIPIPSSFNIPVLQFLQFGFPLEFDGKSGVNTVLVNHKGVREFPVEIKAQIAKDIAMNACIGPFEASPFGKNVRLSPLNSIPQKDTSDRRLILDLSFPIGNSVSDGIPKDSYQGINEKLTLPSVDDLVMQIVKLGRSCLLFKVDLSKAYKQVSLDPKHIRYMGFVVDEEYFFECTLLMGSRSSARCCQMVTSAVVYIFTEDGFFAVNYLNDIGSADTQERAWESFTALRNLLVKIGLKEALDKACPPSSCMVFLGIEVNTISMSLKIPSKKLEEIIEEVKKWSNKREASRKQVQKLAGLLNFACRCVRSGQIYLARILNFLRSTPVTGFIKIPCTVYDDITWWQEFAPMFNDVSLMMENEFSLPDLVISSDSCLSGGGALSSEEFFHVEYPQDVKKRCTHINQLECIVLVVAVKLWAKNLQWQRFVMNCDNQTTVWAINSGTSRDEVIQVPLRELHKVLALNSCEVHANFVQSLDNRLADDLSRWHLDWKYRVDFEERTKHQSLVERQLKPDIFNFIFRK